MATADSLSLESPDSTSLQTMLVGDWQTSELADAIQSILVESECLQISPIDEACEQLRTCDLPPELIFLAQPLPGDVKQSEVDRLQSIAPLTRIILVAGTWCEGELRTGTPPTGVIRLYWYELASWWQAAMRHYRDYHCPLWSLPLDHAQAGRWSADASDTVAEPQIHVLVEAHNFSVYETLSSGLTAYGIHTTWSRHQSANDKFNAGIWDGSQLGVAEQKRLAEFCKQVAGPVVVLLDFPRREHFQLAKEIGATAVFGKPYVVGEVAAAISEHKK